MLPGGLQMTSSRRTRPIVGRTGVAVCAGALVVSTFVIPDLAAPASAAIPASTELVSVSTKGLGGNGPVLQPPAGAPVLAAGDLSADGRYVVFESTASDLVAKDANKAKPDVFLRDRETGKTLRVGATGVGGAGGPTVSADGKVVSFSSTEPLVKGDKGGRADVYVASFGAKKPERITRPNGKPIGEALNEDISGDGRYVLLRTTDKKLNGRGDDSMALLVHDRRANTLTRVDQTPTGQLDSYDAFFGSMSPNGRYVAFTAQPRAESEGAGCPCVSVYLRDRDPGDNGVMDEADATTTLVSSTPAGVPADGHSIVRRGSVDDAGDVVFVTFAPNLGADVDTAHALLRTPDGALQKIATDIYDVAISGNGRAIGFSTVDSRGDAADEDGDMDSFVLDRDSGVEERITVGAAGSTVGRNEPGIRISDDARFVTFRSAAPGLRAAGSPDEVNLFVRDRGIADTPGSSTTIVEGGETLQTGGADAGATDQVPVQTKVQVPSGVEGMVLVRSKDRSPSAAGFAFLGRQIDLTLPPATVTDPYVVTFTLDKSALAGTTPADVQVFRNGELVDRCGSTRQALPDPCVAARGPVEGSDGDVSVTVRTSSPESSWMFGRNRAPVVSAAAVNPVTLSPVDGELHLVTLRGIGDPDGDAVTLTITGITQDEAPEALSRNRNALVGPGPDQVRLRAQRALFGDGRVYRISFRATDASGATSMGSVLVGVAAPGGGPATDSGQKFDAMG